MPLLLLLLALLTAFPTDFQPGDFTPNGYAYASVIVPRAALETLPGDTLFAVAPDDRVYGYVEVPDTGNYVFAVWADDRTVLGADGRNGFLPGERVRLFLQRGGESLPVAYTLGIHTDWENVLLLQPEYARDGLYLLDAGVLSSSAVGFADASGAYLPGEEVDVAVGLQFDASVGDLGALQIDVAGVTEGEIAAGTTGMNMQTAPIPGGGVRLLFDGLSNPVSGGDYTLFRIRFTAGAARSITLSSLIGSLDDPLGSDAGLAIVGASYQVQLTTRGDVDGNGTTNLADFAATIDLILDGEFSAQADLHPFPQGNGSVDVRDLVVLGKAILAGQWPDGIPVSLGSPTIPSTPTSLSKGAPAKRTATDALTLFLSPDGTLWADESGPGLRALQGATSDSLRALSDNSLIRGGDDGFVLYRLAEAMGLPLAYTDAGPDGLRDLEGVLVDGSLVEVNVALATDDEAGPDPADHGPRPVALYPNPVRSGDRLHVEGMAGEATLYDVLGRRVQTVTLSEADEIDLSALPSGIYFLRSEGPNGSGDTRRFTKLD
jgi:hypothetical protein